MLLPIIDGGWACFTRSTINDLGAGELKCVVVRGPQYFLAQKGAQQWGGIWDPRGILCLGYFDISSHFDPRHTVNMQLHKQVSYMARGTYKCHSNVILMKS